MLELDGTMLELDGVTLELEHSISPVIGFILQPDELELLGTTEEEDGTIAEDDCITIELLDTGTVPAAILVGTSRQLKLAVTEPFLSLPVGDTLSLTSASAKVNVTEGKPGSSTSSDSVSSQLIVAPSHSGALRT
jgi:hypothetical protein